MLYTRRRKLGQMACALEQFMLCPAPSISLILLFDYFIIVIKYIHIRYLFVVDSHLAVQGNGGTRNKRLIS